MRSPKFKNLEKNLIRKFFLFLPFLAGMLFPGSSLLASESTFFQEGYSPLPQSDLSSKRIEENTPFSSKEYSNLPFIQDSNNNKGMILRLDGIDPDDDALGEEPVPAGNGLFILIGLGLLFIIYQSIKQMKIKKLLHNNKRVYIVLLLLISFKTVSFATDYYWVGGNGSWADINHWATTSGGTVKLTLPPTASDDVFIDANSGFDINPRISLDVTCLCHNLTSQTTVILSTTNGNLEVWGSFNISPTTTMGYTKITFSSSSPGATITTNGNAFDEVVFNGTGGWKLMDGFTVGNDISFLSGSLDLNGQPVSARNIKGISDSPHSLNIAGSTIICTQGGWSYGGSGSSVLTNAQSAGSTISISNGNMVAKDGDKYNNIVMYVPGNYYGQNWAVYNGSYNKISCLLGNANISQTSSVITDSLILNANAQFTFVKPTTINKYFSATPASACGGQLDLLGGTINMGASGDVNVNHARISNTIINGTGIPYEASNSINAGGNSGWNFLASTNNTYYWVGGSGTWNDINHWASVSGGTPGSGCVPSLLDNAIFDDGSGFTSGSKTVSLDVAGYCNDMKWLGTSVAPTFQPQLNVLPSLEVYGSLYLQAGMTFNPNDFTMSSDRLTETVTTNGVVIPIPTKFKSVTGIGGWSFQDAFASAGLWFYRGHLDFNGQNATINGAFVSYTDDQDYYASRTLNIANSTISALNWIHIGGVPLDAAHSINSLIRLSYTTGQFAKPGDHYYNLELTGNNTVAKAGIYNKITYLASAINGRLEGNIVTDSLLFQTSGTFTFISPITVNKYLATKETCGGITVLTASSDVEQTIMMGNPSVVKVSNAQINYVSITGPGTDYLIPNSIKQGGVDAGWNFGTVVSNTFYWVGNTGNWNDQNHWATTSGGTPGSGCIPSPFDEVIFDSNSFSAPGQTVTVDGSAYCDSMSWIGNASLKPVFSVPNPIQINGSLILQEGMTIPTGALTLSSSRMGETIKSNGVVCHTLSFSGTGEWIALDSICSSGDINFYNGNLNFNGQKVRLQNFYGDSATPSSTLNIANSTIIIEESYWDFRGGSPLTAAQSVNSMIIREKVGVNFKAKPGDVYYDFFINTRTSVYGSSVNEGVFNRLEFTCPAYIKNVTADTLIFSPGGYTNTLYSGSTITVNKNLVTNGTPCLPTTLQTETAGLQVNFSVAKAAANVLPDTTLLEFVRIRDLNAVTGPDRANLKKGPQSSDSGDYGLSGRNTNWTMIPYVGASGFNGLGRDLALGCTDLPYTIQLDPVYYPSDEGSYEWRLGSTTGTIIGTAPQLSINSLGTYYLKVNYDVAKTCNLTDDKLVTVSADSLIWTGLANNSDWNNSSNWRNAGGVSNETTIPRACTDVLIPAGVAVYPNLNMANTSRSVYNNAACRNIHFESGAETAYTDSLYYSKAYVDLTLTRDKWYMLSAPLQNMYSGDYWLAPFNVTVASGAAYNRKNPRVYMQQYQVINPETGYYPGAANWSKSFNTLDVTLGIGQGYVAGIDQAGSPQTFHFPRPETSYEYFNKTSGIHDGRWTPAFDRTTSHRMYIEPGFSEVIPVAWDSITRTTMILGNPFMTHLSFSALHAGNPGVFGTSYYVWTGTSFDAFTTAGDQSSAKTNWNSSDRIAPMQSFIVEKLNPGAQITSINLTSAMTVTDPGNTLRQDAGEFSGMINLAVFRDEVRQSAATLLLEEGKNVQTLFSSTVTPPAIVYFGSKENPFSIFSSDLKKDVEVGIRTTDKGKLTFNMQGTESLSQNAGVFLVDKLTGNIQDMRQNPTYTFNNETGNIEGRFFLRSSYYATGISSVGNNSDINVYAIDNIIRVSSPRESIQQIEVFNVQGQLIYKQNNLNQSDYSFGLNAGKQLLLVKIVTTGGIKTEKLQMK